MTIRLQLVAPGKYPTPSPVQPQLMCLQAGVLTVIISWNKPKTTYWQDHRELREEEDGWAEQQARVVDFLLKTCRLNFTEDDIMWAIGQ